MIIPIGTDNPLRRRPTMNYVLIAINFIIFIYTYQPHDIAPGVTEPLREAAGTYKLFPQEPQIYQFVTYAFLHANWMHLIGNMLFLYIFGNNVNDKLGNLGYLLLYLGGGVCSGLGHALFHNSAVLGASGAVAAVTGAYMVLFPKTYVHVLYWLFFIGTTEIPALYFILFKLILWDNIFPVMVKIPGNIAYGAHLAGYAFGIGIPLVMLVTKLLPHSHYDLWALIERRQRRQQYRKVVNQGYDPFGPSENVRRKVDSKVTESVPLDARTERVRQLRTEISSAANSSNLDQAVDKYLQLMEIDNQQALPQQQQLDIANKLMHNNQHEAAAAAYEVFLQHYHKTYPFIEQIELMVGLIYSRYLEQEDLAKKHLRSALDKLSDPGQKKMCQDELDRLEG
jgi:membrane associated rhomboid family serine protease